MELPPGFEELNDSRNVCKLKKSLYGLKQSPRAWFERFTKSLKLCRFYQSQRDHTLFYKQSSPMKLIVLIVYVDGIIVTSDD